jgi:4-amino-4-deoxy-L-arabinose transferase-like glycosyltransferase
MLQVFWVTASLVGLLRVIDAEEEGKSRWCVTAWWLAALLAVAGGTLTKWTAPAFFYLTAVPLLYLRGRLRALVAGPHLVAAFVAAALVLGWAALAVRQVGWEAFFNTVSQEACQRLVPNEVPLSPPRHHHRPYPWLEVIAHPFVTFGACLPWSPFALLALWPGFARLWDERGRRWLQALHCWLWPNLLFWSVVPEHAPRHSFPFFPAVAGLAAMAWLALLTGRLRWPIARLRPAGAFVGIVALWVVVKIGHVHAVVPARGQGREPQAKGEQLAALVPPGQPLYLCRLKDEGILFYYSRCHPPADLDRIVRRLPGPEALLSTGELAYGIVTEAEWQRGPLRERAEVVQRLRDQQGDPILLVRVRPR